MTWDVPTTGGSPIVSYEVRSWNGSDWVHEGNVAAVKDKTTGYTSTDENLEPNTRYYYVVQARNSVGTGPWSDYLEVSTIAGAPDAPKVTATALSSSSILVSWTVPDDNGEPITGYQVQRWDGTERWYVGSCHKDPRNRSQIPKPSRSIPTSTPSATTTTPPPTT